MVSIFFLILPSESHILSHIFIILFLSVSIWKFKVARSCKWFSCAIRCDVKNCVALVTLSRATSRNMSRPERLPISRVTPQRTLSSYKSMQVLACWLTFTASEINAKWVIHPSFPLLSYLPSSYFSEGESLLWQIFSILRFWRILTLRERDPDGHHFLIFFYSCRIAPGYIAYVYRATVRRIGLEIDAVGCDPSSRFKNGCCYWPDMHLYRETWTCATSLMHSNWETTWTHGT